MKFSIVTLSFNQAPFLERALCSVLEQDYQDIEYIVVDPGSTDGSRDIIEKYRARISKVILEPDRGAADGLNKGFATATGDVYGFLNSDDVLLPGAIRRVASYFQADPGVDIVLGHEWIIDADDRLVRKAYTDKFNERAFAYRGGVISQQSTFFRAGLFKEVNGFDVQLDVNWDAELFLDMLRVAKKPQYVDDFFGAFRLHGESITGGKKLDHRTRAYELRRFAKVMGRNWKPSDELWLLYYRIRKYVVEPRALWERVRRGSYDKRV